MKQLVISDNANINEAHSMSLRHKFVCFLCDLYYGSIYGHDNKLKFVFVVDLYEHYILPMLYTEIRGLRIFL